MGTRVSLRPVTLASSAAGASAASTSVDLATNYDVMPQDNVSNAMMLEVHFYSPYNFTMMTKDESWGNQAYYWGSGNHVSGSIHNATWGEESYMQSQMRQMKTKYTSKGIPVIMGAADDTFAAAHFAFVFDLPIIIHAGDVHQFTALQLHGLGPEAVFRSFPAELDLRQHFRAVPAVGHLFRAFRQGKRQPGLFLQPVGGHVFPRIAVGQA